MADTLGIQINKYPSLPTPYVNAGSGIDSFSISYDISWDSVSVYGRQDPIQQYQTTGEVLSVTFPMTSDNDYETLPELTEILEELSKLARPVYNKIYKGVEVINTSPLIELFIMNTDWSASGRRAVAADNQTTLWGGKIYIVAPTSINFDFGDRSRQISASTEGGSLAGLKNLDLGAAQSLPKKCLVSLSGPIISTEIKYAINTNKFDKDAAAAAAAISATEDLITRIGIISDSATKNILDGK
jgi:hypothetical protein